METFTTLDFAHYLDGTFEDQRAFSKDLVSALRSRGFVKLRNYGMPARRVDELFNLARAYFKLALEEKLSGSHPENAFPHRGYSRIGQEKISGISGFEKGVLIDEGLCDIKETFDMGSMTDIDYPNIWPLKRYIPNFRAQMELAFEENHQYLVTVLESVALGLDLPKQEFARLHSLRDHEFRLLHYPAVDADELKPGSGKCRIAEHSDFGSLTLLMQDSVGGLLVEDQDRPRVFHNLDSEPYEVILNVGDCLQRWTGGLLRSANHKVTLPADKLGDTKSSVVPERFSIAFFGKPNRDALISVLPQLVSEASMMFPPITAGAYNLEKLVRTY